MLRAHKTLDLGPVVPELLEQEPKPPAKVAEFSESSDSFAPIRAPPVPQVQETPDFLESVSLAAPPPIQETPSSAFTLAIPNLSLLQPEKESAGKEIVVNSPSVPVPPVPEEQGPELQMLRIPKIQFDSPSTEKLDAPSPAEVQSSPLRQSFHAPKEDGAELLPSISIQAPAVPDTFGAFPDVQPVVLAELPEFALGGAPEKEEGRVEQQSAPETKNAEKTSVPAPPAAQLHPEEEQNYTLISPQIDFPEVPLNIPLEGDLERLPSLHIETEEACAPVIPLILEE